MLRPINVLLIVFLTVGVNVGCNKKGGTGQPAIHISERVKIERPADQPGVQAKEKPKGSVQMASDGKELGEEPVQEMAKHDAVEEDAASKAERDDTDHKLSSSEKENTVVDTSSVRPLPEKVAEQSVASKSAVQSPAAKEEFGHRSGIKEKDSQSASEKILPEDDESLPELTDATDLVGEQEALFGDRAKYYVKKGRVDPFAPFLNKPEPKTTEVMKKEIQRRTPRTPLERIALGQLTLTAVMRLPDQEESMALVEDSNGKGYIVKRGTYIGEKGGRVSSVLADKLVVEEKYDDVFGKTSVRQIELKLQKQLGE